MIKIRKDNHLRPVEFWFDCPDYVVYDGMIDFPKLFEKIEIEAMLKDSGEIKIKPTFAPEITVQFKAV